MKHQQSLCTIVSACCSAGIRMPDYEGSTELRYKRRSPVHPLQAPVVAAPYTLGWSRLFAFHTPNGMFAHMQSVHRSWLVLHGATTCFMTFNACSFGHRPCGSSGLPATRALAACMHPARMSRLTCIPIDAGVIPVKDEAGAPP